MESVAILLAVDQQTSRPINLLFYCYMIMSPVYTSFLSFGRHNLVIIFLFPLGNRGNVLPRPEHSGSGSTLQGRSTTTVQWLVLPRLPVPGSGQQTATAVSGIMRNCSMHAIVYNCYFITVYKPQEKN